jgi:ribosome-associated toxin RatA of RatAB toxin-antitoxin module
MPRIKITKNINASAETLFELSSDYQKRLEWDKFIKRIEFLGETKRIDKDVVTRTYAYNGLKMDTKFITYKPSSAIAFEMIKGPFFFKSMAGTWTFNKLNTNQTQVSFIYSFSTKPRILQHILDFVIYWILKRDMRNRLSNLKLAAESNE